MGGQQKRVPSDQFEQLAGVDDDIANQNQLGSAAEVQVLAVSVERQQQHHKTSLAMNQHSTSVALPLA